MGALNCGILNSRLLLDPESTPGVLGNEKSTGAVRGALAYPPVNALPNEPPRVVAGLCGELRCAGRALYWFRRSKPGGKAEDDARRRDNVEGFDCCIEVGGPCDDEKFN